MSGIFFLFCSYTVSRKDNALESDLIDSYIYEINALQKRYQHLTELAALQPADREKNLYQHSPIRALVSHVFG